MEGRNDPPEYRVSSIARQYIHASFLRRNPQHAGCGHGREYAGAVTISFTQSDASDVTSATASLRSVRPATVVFHFSALAFRAAFTLLIEAFSRFSTLVFDDSKLLSSPASTSRRSSLTASLRTFRISVSTASCSNILRD